MNFITGKHLSRRTFLRSTGASVALPLLDSMVPAGRAWRDPAQESFTRLVCVEESMGCAGGNDWGDTQHLFAPATVGRDFEFLPQSQLKPLEPYREYLTIVSQTDCRMAEPFVSEEIGGDHDRSTAVFLTQSHPLQTKADVFIRFARALRPGGVLVLGAGETVIGQTDAFEPSRRLRGFYERAARLPRASAA